MVLKNLSRFEPTHCSNSGSHCNQRGFHPFLAKAQGLALFFLPSLFFPSLAGGKRNAWLESELVMMWTVSSMGSYEVLLPPAHQESKSRKGSSSLESQVLIPTSPWPQKLHFGVSQFLCLFWHHPLLFTAASRLRACSRHPSHCHVHQTLTITSMMGWSSRSCRRRSPRTNPLSGLRKPFSTMRFTHWQQMSTRKNNHSALLVVCRLSRPAGPGTSHLLVPAAG